jgi:DNA polymerase III subunit delta'
VSEEKNVLAGPPPPRANPQLLGHARAERRIERWMGSGALPHALLICGAWGIGKATMAYRIARSLLRRASTGTGLFDPGRPRAAQDEGGTALDPADETFRWVASGTHPDLLTVERRFDDKRGRTQTDIVVEDVRRIGAFLSSSPAFGGWRVVVIDAADEMNRHAANALLKVLEEPNANCLLILVAHRPALVPATVRSRCRRLLLQPLGDDVLRVLMARFLPDLPAEDAAVLCALGEGSIGRALQLAKHQGLAVDRSSRDFFRALAARDRRALVAAAANVAPGPAPDEEQFRVASHILFWWLRRIALACLSGAPAVSSAASAPPSEEATAIESLAAASALDHWLKVWDKSHHLAAQADAGNLDRKQVLMTILLEMQRELHFTLS